MLKVLACFAVTLEGRPILKCDKWPRHFRRGYSLEGAATAFVRFVFSYWVAAAVFGVVSCK